MHATAVKPFRVRCADESVETVLHHIHDVWLANTRRFLGPTLEPHTDQWTRWGAVRYLADDFQDQYQWERALLGELRPFLFPATATQLTHQADRIARLHLELDRIGRRRGTAEEFAGGARYLMEQHALWCAELELAGRSIAVESLTPEAVRILNHLQAVSTTPE